MRQCFICRGEGRIRLPIYRPLSVTRIDDIEPIIDDAYREYACPECGDLVPLERIAIIRTETFMDIRAPRECEKMAAEDAAHRMVARLMNNGFITCETGEDDIHHLKRAIRTTLGVVSKATVAKLEERISQRQAEVAKEVAEEAIHQIVNWRSYYVGSGGHIQKQQAADYVRESFKHIIERRSMDLVRQTKPDDRT